jgi:hypothetical protein
VPGFDDAAAILALKQRENPFLEYVAHGSTDRMLAQILAKCLAPENDPPHARFQWTWERADDEQPPPFKQTMYWDCLTVGNLYKNGPPDSPGVPSPPNLNDAINQSNAGVANATAAVNSIIASVGQLIKDCEKIQGKCAVALLNAPLEHIRQEAEHALDQISKGQVPTPIGAPTLPIPAPSLPTPSKPIPESPKPKVRGCPCGGFFCPCRR